MASKSASKTTERPADIEDLLDVLEKGLDRLKVMYEQYFLGIQKIAPMQLHSDTERKIRDLTQMQIRNTAMRYRFNQLQAKFVSYNAYWRRTTRQIENGTYTRNLSRVGRRAALTGADVPEEILAAMPKRMREQVLRDREAAVTLGKRRGKVATVPPGQAAPPDLEDDDEVSFIGESTGLRAGLRTVAGAHVIDPGDAELDLDQLLARAEAEAAIAGAAAASSTRMAAARTRDSSATIPDAMLGIPSEPMSPADSGVSFRPPREVVSPPPAMRAGMPPLPRAATPPPIGERANRRTAVPAPARDTPPGGLAARSSSPALPAVTPPAPRPKLPSVIPPTIPSSPPRPQAMPLRSPSSPGMPPLIPGIPGIPPMPGKLPSVPRPAVAAAPEAPPVAARPTTLGTPPMRAPTPAPPPRAATAPPVASRPTMLGTPPARASTPVPVAQPPLRRSEPSIQKGPERPPAGMTDADVNTLYAKYVKAKEMVGEAAGPGAYGKLLKTINAQAPKIMDQYKAKSVEFSIVVKDNQVIIRAKPKS